MHDQTDHDFDQETAAERLVQIACSQFDAPCGLISVLGEEHTLMSAVVGLCLESVKTDVSVTRMLVEAGPGAVMVVEDALADARVRDHPLVTGPAALRFYAGATVTNRDGVAVGSIAVMDTVPRPPLTAEAIRGLQRLARLAGDFIDQGAVERARAEQLRTLSLAEGMAGVGHWRLDIASGKVFWSDEVYRIHGVERATFDPSYDDAVGFYRKEDQPLVRAAVSRALETGEPYAFKLTITRADGEDRIVVSRGAAELDSSGQAASAFGVFQDITEAEHSRQRIAESEERYRLLAERASDVIVVYGLDAVFTYVSASVETVLGYKPEELIGKTTWSVIHSDDHAAVGQAFAAYEDANVRPARIRYRARAKDGRWLWLEAHPKLVRDAAGRPVKFQDSVRDVSETKALETALIEARDAAEAAARAKSEFLSNMSHELRTPLTGVVGFAGLLADSVNLPELERRYVDRIRTASDALLSVINDILDYSKLDAEAVELEVRAFDPAVMVCDALALIEVRAEAAGISFSTDIAETTPPAAAADEGRLRQVLLNLLSNAVKFTPGGRIDVRMMVMTERPQEEWLRIEVQDTGIGIAADKIETLFERFTQADSSTTRLYGGTGLGLAISARLIDLMGGRIGATSSLGEGSCFWLEIPLIRADLQLLSTLPKLATGPLNFQARILVADDNPANRELVTALLSGLGFEVDTVSNGLEATDAVATGCYDLVLMDVHMPVMDGLDATRGIRRLQDDRATVPIIALTAGVEADQIEQCFAAGMDDHLTKPINMGDLVSVLATWLDGDDRPQESLSA